MAVLSIDFESHATVDLRKAGVYPYAAHKNTDVFCMAWAFDDEEPRIWTPPGMEHDPDGLPERIFRHIEAGGEIRAWNAQFERTIWREIMVKRYGATEIQDKQFVCTAAEAAAMALPRSLDQAAIVLGLKEEKDTEGYALMLRMTKPRAFKEDGTPIWWHEAKDGKARLERLYEYCKQDVRVERAAKKALRPLSKKEREVYLLDQRVNDRGVYVDRELIAAAKVIADEGVDRANAVLCELTDGAVEGVTKTTALRAWIETESGKTVPSIDKAVVAEMMLESDLDPRIRTALQIRSDVGRSSIAKLDSMLAVAGTDGRARGLSLYHGASTGRWAGKLIQPQNFPRGDVKDVEAFIPDVLEENFELINLFAHPVPVISSMLRSMLCAAPGHDLIAGDFSAIECRVVNWLAGQEDVLEHFRRFDSGDDNHSPYKVMAVRMGLGASTADIRKSSAAYQTGKAVELGCGFGMGAEKYVTSTWNNYQTRVTPEEAEKAVDIYRSTHARVKEFWYETEAAVARAINKPGEVVFISERVRAVVAGNYLNIVLPSNRLLCYAAPRIVYAETHWSLDARKKAKEAGEEVPPPSMRNQIEFYAVHPLTKKWLPQRTYGGHLVENIVQGVARDFLAWGMLRLEKLGIPIVLHAHDEAVAEIPKESGLTPEEFCAILAELPSWAKDCPITATGWRGNRYRK